MNKCHRPSRQRQKSIEEYFQKQQKLNVQIQEEQVNHKVVSQPMLSYHRNCTSFCLDYTERCCIFKFPKHISSHIEMDIKLEECHQLIKEIVDERLRIKFEKRKKRIITKTRIKKRLGILTLSQRKEIVKLKQKGFKNGVIAAILQVSSNQVKKNEIIMNSKKCKMEVKIEEKEKQWILDQATKDSNSMLFRADTYFSQFKNQFKKSRITLYQFRKLLHSLNISHYPFLISKVEIRIQFNSLNLSLFISKTVIHLCLSMNAPLVTFQNKHTNNGILYNHSNKTFIEFLPLDIQLRQWGKKISCFTKCSKALVKLTSFMIFYILSFRELENIIQMANLQQLWIIAPFTRAQCLKILLESFDHVFTLAYRPEFNAIEKLFGWLKRKVVQDQPMLSNQFDFRIHQAFSLLNEVQINEWCMSIYKPMLNELE